MVTYQKYHKAIKIISKSRILPWEFKIWFLGKLTEEYDLYEVKNGNATFISKNDIIESTVLSTNQISSLKDCYVLDKIIDLSFEEFIESQKVLFANIYVFEKNSKIFINELKNKGNLFGVIDLNPDGDVKTIWIDTLKKDEIFIGLLEQYCKKI